MKTYAWQEGARRYLREVMDIQSIGICLVDEPGRIEFAFPVRYMQMASQAIKAKVQYTDYTFERSAHFIADVFILDRNRAIRLHHQMGSLRAIVCLFDNQERDDDLGGAK